jgi:hypothetical protein
MNSEAWNDLVNDWKKADPADFRTVVWNWDGWIIDTGGGVEVGYVPLKDEGIATVTDESIQLWKNGEPFSDDEGDVVVYSENVR